MNSRNHQSGVSYTIYIHVQVLGYLFVADSFKINFKTFDLKTIPHPIPVWLVSLCSLSSDA